MLSENLIKAVVATAQVMGNDLTEDAARMMCSDLADYPEPKVMEALQRTRREVKGRLAVSDVIARIDDGRPGPNEAWAMIPKTENESVVWTDEMCAAYGAAASLMDDPVAARVAFIETYQREITRARTAKLPAKWWPSLGFDKAGREPVIRKAFELGRLTAAQAMKALPNATFEEQKALEAPERPRIGGEWHISKLLGKPDEKGAA